jgi:tetratricopeptide (TPR) repeat protein
MKHALTARVSLILVLISLAGSVVPFLRAQGDDWDKHMKAGGKAFESGRKEKYVWLDPGRSTPASVRDFAKAEEEFLAALAQTQSFPAGDVRKAHTLGSLADVYMEEGHFVEAEERGNEAIHLVEASAGPDDPRLGRDLALLATIYDYDSKPEQAGPLWDRSLAILSKSGGADPEFLSHLNFVAQVLRLKPAIDEQIYKYILGIEESTAAPDKDLRIALGNLATVQRGADAEQDYSRIAEIDKRIYGPDAPATTIDLESLGEVYCDEGKYPAALPHLQHALEVREKNGPAFESEFAKQFAVSAILRLHKEKLAKESAQSALLRLERELAQAYTGSGKYTEAEELYKRIIPTDDASTTPNRDANNMQLSGDLIGLSAVYRHEHRFDEALNTIKRSETIDDEIANSKFERENAKTAEPSMWLWFSQIELAEIYREKGDTTAAETLFQRSEEEAQSLTLAPGHPKLAMFLDNYATLLRDEGKYIEAEALYKHALDTWARSRYPDHPDVAGTLTDYAKLLRKLDRATEAESLEARASAILATAGTPSPTR